MERPRRPWHSRPMQTQAECQAELQFVLDALGPSASYSVGPRTVRAAFGDGGTNAARHFAEARECLFVPDEDGGGVFRRAHPKAHHAPPSVPATLRSSPS